MAVVHCCEHLTAIVITSVLLLEVSSVKLSCKFERTQRTLESETEYFTNAWAVRIPGGVNRAKKIARNLGFHLQSKISEGLADIYLFHNFTYPKKTNYLDNSVTELLLRCPEISWVEQQIAEVRMTRRYNGGSKMPGKVQSELSWDDSAEAYSCPDLESANDTQRRVLNLNDKYWPRQYYIKDCRRDYRKTPHDLNLAPVWVKHRFFGKNIKVIVVDDGLETKHLDLVDNYDRSLGLDLQDDDDLPDPVPYLWRKFSHGTQCAGIIGMRGNNTICGVGIAPSITLGAVRLLGPIPVTDYKISTALAFKHADVHIMSNSWGPRDDGKAMPYMGPLTRGSLKIGVTKGRGDRGVIYVFAVGNGKRKGDHCGCDAMISSIYTIAVASCDHKGQRTDFSERCASIMVTTYSAKRGDLHKVVTTYVGGNRCTTDHFGTSASAPMVAGAIALALEANPKLSWRDVQHLLAWTCQVAPLRNNGPISSWQMNGAGFYVSHDFGFGMLDINGLVEKAIGFQSVGSMNTCVTRVSWNENGEPFNERFEIETSINGCEGTPSEVKYLEHVQLTVSIAFPRRGDLEIILISPSGTKARLLEQRYSDSYVCGLRNWSFDSVMTWGESPKGKWKIVISAKSRKGGSPRSESLPRTFWYYFKNGQVYRVCFPPGYVVPADSKQFGDLTDLTLIFRGTSGRQMPHHYTSGPRTYNHFQ